jgi:hypothetical protein
MKDNKIDLTTNMIRCQILIKSTMRYHHVEIRSIIGTFHLKITDFLDRATLESLLRERESFVVVFGCRGKFHASLSQCLVSPNL